jgi:hypothetical protein
MNSIQSAEFSRKWTNLIKRDPTVICVHQISPHFSDNLEVISPVFQALRIQEFDR